MRYQGTLTGWEASRGFGFVSPNGGGERAFVHIAAFGRRTRAPENGDQISYAVLRTAKGLRAIEVAFVEHHLAPRTRSPRHDAPARPAWRRYALGLACVATLVIGARARQLQPATPAPEALAQPTLQTPPATATPAGESFRCAGKTRCTEMRSCAEAKFYLAHCPSPQLDGDHDGIPCEQQWCR